MSLKKSDEKSVKGWLKPSKILLMTAVFLFGMYQGMAFDSLKPTDVLKIAVGKSVDGAVHGEITRESLSSFQIKEDIVKKIVEANWRTDWDESKKSLPPVPNERYNPAHHFDRNQGDTHPESFTRGAKFLQDQRKIIIAGLKGADGKNFDDAAVALGQALHALQDFFSHSNVIDLSPNEWDAVMKSLKGASDPPSVLKITGFDKKRGGDIQNDEYGHDTFCKDNPKKNNEAKSFMNTGAKNFVAGKIKFQRAKEAAVEYSKLWLKDIQDEVGLTVWSQLQK